MHVYIGVSHSPIKLFVNFICFLSKLTVSAHSIHYSETTSTQS